MPGTELELPHPAILLEQAARGESIHLTDKASCASFDIRISFHPPYMMYI